MTKRAIVLGILGAILICTLTYFNDFVLRQTYLVGNHLPVSVFGTLVVFLFFNAYIYRLSHKIALTGREMALIMAMTLSACVVPTSGLMRTFSSALLMPHRMEKVQPAWKQARIIDEIVPEIMLADVSKKIHQGELAGTTEAGVKLGADADKVSGRLRQAKIHMLTGPAKGQVRRIREYDTETRLATLDQTFDKAPAAGDRYEITVNNEEEILTPYIQGQSSSKLETPVIPISGVTPEATIDSIQLSKTSSVDDTYNGMTVTITSGSLQGTSRTIADYDGKSKVATLSEPWPSIPEVNARYRVEHPTDSSRLLFWIPTRVSGIVQQVDGADIILPDTLSNISGAFCDMPITFLTGPLKDKTFSILAYNGKDRKVTLDEAPETAPQVGDTFEIVFERDVQLSGEARALPAGSEDADKKIRLGESAGHRDNEYSGLSIQITSGPGEGQKRAIAEYDGLQQIATVDRAWDTPPEAGSIYQVIEKPLVPWHGWSRTLWFWVPIILALFLALIGLSFVFHRQWAEHEHLPYPIATFAASLMPEEDSGRSSLVKDKRFLIAAGIVLVMYVYNYTCSWFPDQTVAIPTSFNIRGLITLLPLGGSTYQLWTIRIFFTVIAIAYFLPSDVSLSLGLSRGIFSFVMGILTLYGISLDSGPTGAIQYGNFLVAGAYVGTMIIILYTGRFYYGNVVKEALFMRSKDKLPATSIWGMRLFIAGLAAFTIILSRTGLDWQLGLLAGLAMVIMFSVMARIIAETGLFFIQTHFIPCAIVVGLMGTKALDPKSIFIIYLVTIVIAVDPREALMPFFANNLKLLDLRRLKLGRAGTACTAALLIGLAVGLPATIATQYKFGANLNDGHAFGYVPKTSFEETLQLRQRMMAQGTLEQTQKLSGFARFLKIKPIKPGLLLAMAVGAALVILFSLLRLRFNKWPLHPVLFLVWSAWAPGNFWSSFMLGWVFKVVVMRFGGSKIYQSLKPVVLGLVAGELVGAIIPIIVGFIYFLITGELPRKFMIFPV